MVVKHALNGAANLTVTGKNGRHLLGVEYRHTNLNGKRLAYIVNVLDHPVELRLRDQDGPLKKTTDLISGGPVTAKLNLKSMGIVMFLF